MWGIGEAIDAMFRTMAVLILVSVPLALWKLIDIAIWLWSHVEVTPTPPPAEP